MLLSSKNEGYNFVLLSYTARGSFSNNFRKKKKLTYISGNLIIPGTRCPHSNSYAQNRKKNILLNFFSIVQWVLKTSTYTASNDSLSNLKFIFWKPQKIWRLQPTNLNTFLFTIKLLLLYRFSRVVKKIIFEIYQVRRLLSKLFWQGQIFYFSRLIHFHFLHFVKYNSINLDFFFLIKNKKHHFQSIKIFTVSHDTISQYIFFLKMNR